jgi:hypothetical protein
MARQRFIWPTIWDDPDLGRLPEAARLLYIACFSNADDEGRLIGDPTNLRSLAFRYQDITTDEIVVLRDQVAKACRSFRVYTKNDIEYIAFANWDEFQKPKYPKASTLPPPPGYRRNVRKPAETHEKSSPTVPPKKRNRSRTRGEPLGDREGLGRVGLGLTTGGSSTEDRRPEPDLPNANGLPFETEMQLLKIVEYVGDHADDRTTAVLRKHATHLPPAALAKVLESAQTAKPRQRAAYIVAALKAETNAKA